MFREEQDNVFRSEVWEAVGFGNLAYESSGAGLCERGRAPRGEERLGLLCAVDLQVT